MGRIEDAKIEERMTAIIDKNVVNGWEVRPDVVYSLLLWQDFGILPGSSCRRSLQTTWRRLATTLIDITEAGS